MEQGKALVWFRQDLRLHDNPALYHAAQLGGEVIPLYIHDATHGRPKGSANKWWLHHSLKSLSDDLMASYGKPLSLMQGHTREVLTALCQSEGITHVYWNRLYDAKSIHRDSELKAQLKASGVQVQSFNGSLLHEPWDILNNAGHPFKVFTPFWKALKTKTVRASLPKPQINALGTFPYSLDLDSLCLLPTIPWDTTMRQLWRIGEDAAIQALDHFLNVNIPGYKTKRDRPDLDSTSRLSAHLHFGEISPVKIWHQTLFTADSGKAPQVDCDHFLSELAWREFSYGLLFTHPDLHWIPLRSEFQSFPTRNAPVDLLAWQQGQTGYPIVDAGMRQLWRTGWMHNRVRMIVASFLIKDLLLPWQLGEEWFWDTLVDADPANNAASWQWVAGCGADAAPYFRIFNPILQGEKFDPDGTYVRTWIPELKSVPTTHIHKPWTLPIPPKNYPLPMIDHKAARTRALDAYKQMKAI